MNMHRKRAAATLLLLGLLLGIKNGRIALWKQDDPQPIHIFPWSAALLPAPIRQALEQGLHVESESDLGRLLLQLIA